MGCEMTRARIYGSDVEFCRWLRGCKLLPSHDAAAGVGVVASDVDVFLHRYMMSVDGVGTRQVQAMGFLEVKTRGGGIRDSQSDTLWKAHMMSKGQSVFDGIVLRHYGVGFLFMDGTSPDDSGSMEWGRFQKNRSILRKAITLTDLIDLLKFDRHWHNLTRNPFRRHHKTRTIYGTDVAPLGFEVDTVVQERS